MFRKQDQSAAGKHYHRVNFNNWPASLKRNIHKISYVYTNDICDMCMFFVIKIHKSCLRGWINTSPLPRMRTDLARRTQRWQDATSGLANHWMFSKGITQSFVRSRTDLVSVRLRNEPLMVLLVLPDIASSPALHRSRAAAVELIVLWMPGLR